MLPILFLGALLSSAQALSEASRAALRFGDCRIAMMDLAGPGDSATTLGQAEHLALARCALAAGDLDRAEMLAALGPGSSLGPYGVLLQAEARLQRGDPSGAAQLLTGLELPGAAGQRAAMLLGRAQIEMGAHSAGKDTLNALLQGTFAARGKLADPGGADPAEVRWWLAQGAIQRGEPKAAIGVLLRIWQWNPTSPRSEQAQRVLLELGVDVTDTTLAEGRSRVRDRARTLQKLRLYPEALALIEPLPRHDTDPKTIRDMARLTFKAKQYNKAVEWYAKIPDPNPVERFDHALATSRTGDYAAAAVLYTKLYESLPNTKQGDTASYKVGYLSYDSSDLDQAIPLLRAHLKRYPSSKHADEARWFIAWSLYRQGDLKAADRAMAEVIEKHGRGGLAAGAIYWRARIAAEQGREADAFAGYKQVRNRFPTTGYAWFAMWRMGEALPAKPEPAAPGIPPALAQQLPWTNGNALAAVGLDDWARTELGPLVAGAKSTTPARLAMAHALVQAGDFVTAQSLAKRSCSAPWKPATDPTAMALCYPRPGHTATVELAKKGGLPGNLPFGIMTAESALKPWVTSPVGARGLMQLMPEVAESLSPTVFGEQPFHPDDLYRPGVNTALGVAELTRLHEQFAGRLDGPALPAVIAGYNGGAEAVERWLSAYDSPPEPDRFAEDIGYTETRRYVRRVLGYMQAYRYVYGD